MADVELKSPFLKNVQTRLINLGMKIETPNIGEILVKYSDTIMTFCRVYISYGACHIQFYSPWNINSSLNDWREVQAHKVVEKISDYMNSPEAKFEYEAYTGMRNDPDTVPTMIRIFSEKLHESVRDIVAWRYHDDPDGKYIIVYFPNDLTVCKIMFKAKPTDNFPILRDYVIRFYYPFTNPSPNIDGRAHTESVASTNYLFRAIDYITQAIYERKPSLRKEEHNNMERKSTLLADLRGQLQQFSVDIAAYHNAENNSCKFMVIPYGNLTLCEVFGLFDINGLPEDLLIVDYYHHDSEVTASPSMAARRIRDIIQDAKSKNWSGEFDLTKLADDHRVTADIHLEIGSVTADLQDHDLMIENVIFQDPATVVFWSDGSKTVVKTQDGEPYDPEKGLAMAIAKRSLGNDRSYYRPFLKWVGKYNKKKAKEEKEKNLAHQIVDRMKAGDWDGVGKIIKESGYTIKAAAMDADMDDSEVRKLDSNESN